MTYSSSRPRCKNPSRHKLPLYREKQESPESDDVKTQRRSKKIVRIFKRAKNMLNDDGQRKKQRPYCQAVVTRVAEEESSEELSVQSSSGDEEEKGEEESERTWPLMKDRVVCRKKRKRKVCLKQHCSVYALPQNWPRDVLYTNLLIHTEEQLSISTKGLGKEPRKVSIQNITSRSHPCCGQKGVVAMQSIGNNERILDYTGRVIIDQDELDSTSSYLIQLRAGIDGIIDHLQPH